MLPRARGRRSRRDPRRRRLRIGDGVELQSPSAAGRSAGRRRRAGASSAGGRRSTTCSLNLSDIKLDCLRTCAERPDVTVRLVMPDTHRVRRTRPERQADAGGAAARSPEAGRAQGAAGVVSRLRHVDRRGDRARAAGRARVRARRDAAAVRREPLRAESRTCSDGSTAG